MEFSTSDSQNPRILQVYNVYRVVLAFIFVVTFVTGGTASLLGAYDPDLFFRVSVSYTLLSIIFAFVSASTLGFRSDPTYVSGLFIVDIFAISLLTYSCGGMISGLGYLELFTIAASGILIKGRVSTFLAAIATISIIYCEFYIYVSADNQPSQFLQAGILGIILFITSLYLQTVTNRIYRSAQIADQQAIDIIDLEKLKNEIFQRMRTGIIVVDDAGIIVTMNGAAERMLLNDPESKVHSSLPSILEQQLASWRQNKQIRPTPFLFAESGPQFQANFTYLNPALQSNVLIFIEDNSQIIQRVRQMKLASLGRLTASIAHEIRNPLGAISHASQLLVESSNITDDDVRLTEIILAHCKRVDRIIEDILDVSRHKEDSSEKINLQQWLVSYIKGYHEAHKIDGTISVKIEPSDTMIRVIPSQFEQILNNLFENGLRYSKMATGVENLQLEGGYDESQDDQLPFLLVIDDGPGVAPEAEEHIFEPFHTTESRGTGLGLYISKELCEANQARLSYRRTVSGKSCFSIHFSHVDRNVI